jgi:hypothetical protein
MVRGGEGGRLRIHGWLCFLKRFGYEAVEETAVV